MTAIQSALNKLQAFQECKGFQLGGKGPELKYLATEIKYLWPTLNEGDKALFTAAVARGCFAIEKKYIWPMFLDAVGMEAPEPTPTGSPAPAPQTNKVAAEILDVVKEQVVWSKMVNDRMHILHEIMLDYRTIIDNLREQVAELKRPPTKKRAESLTA
jgi:hypothetical protein